MFDEKKTQSPKVHMGETLFLELAKLANQEGLALSTYLERVLYRHAYGHRIRDTHQEEGPARVDSALKSAA